MKILAIFLLISTSVMAQSGQRIDKKNRIIYKYKKYQKFDFEDLVIQGETGSPGDISVDPRKNFDFKNKSTDILSEVSKLVGLSIRINSTEKERLSINFSNRGSCTRSKSQILSLPIVVISTSIAARL